MTGLKLPAKFARTITGAYPIEPKVWLLKLSCGHVTTRHRRAEAPRDARCAVCARGSR